MKITVKAEIAASLDKAWQVWTRPEFITRWNFASPDWCCPRASIDLRVGGRFNYRMEACDGSMGFDFEGEFTEVQVERRIAYVLGDEREVTISFTQIQGQTLVEEVFDTENENPVELQRQGWQSILDNFKRIAEKV